MDPTRSTRSGSYPPTPTHPEKGTTPCFTMKRIAMLAVIIAAATVPAVGAQAAHESNVNAPGRDASIAPINKRMPSTKRADRMRLDTFHEVGISHEPRGLMWDWTDMSG